MKCLEGWELVLALASSDGQTDGQQSRGGAGPGSPDFGAARARFSEKDETSQKACPEVPGLGKLRKWTLLQ